MKTFVKVLVCCLLIGSLCGCQLTKNPATTSSVFSSVSKENVESLSHTVEDVYSVASEETSSAVSKIDNSINSVASVESSNSPSSVYSSGSKNTATASTILSSSQSSVITSSQNDSSTSLDATNSNQLVAHRQRLCMILMAKKQMYGFLNGLKKADMKKTYTIEIIAKMNF